MATATISVYFKLSSGKAFSAEHLPSDTVKVVANGVAKTEGIPEGRVRLKYQGKPLDMTKTIGYLGVCAETILKVEIITAQDWTVQIKLPGGKEESIGIQNVDTVRRLRQIIADIPGGPEVSRQIIKVRGGGTVNKADATLLELGITDGAVLDVADRGDTSSNTEIPKMVDEELDEDKKMELMSTFDTQGKQVDVVFCFDTTGSMYSCLQTVRQKLRDTCSRLLRDIPRMRIGLMANGDYCDYAKYVVRYVDLTSNLDELVTFAADVPSTGGGGNGGECYEWALRKAQQLDWSEDSAKALVMIGDELPHPPSYTDQNLFWKDEVDVLRGMGVKVYGVQALDRGESTPFYQEMSERTDGYYLRLRNFSLITDMFLAVCYRESDQQQLEAFVEEVETEGRMTEDAKNFLKTLETENKPSETTGAASTSRTERSINAGWWNPALDSARSPQYVYDAETDKWAPIGASQRRTSGTTSTTSSTGMSFGSASDAPIRQPVVLNLPPAKKSLFKRMVNRIFR